MHYKAHNMENTKFATQRKISRRTKTSNGTFQCKKSQSYFKCAGSEPSKRNSSIVKYD